MTTTWGYAQEFLPKFQSECTDLAARIQSATTSNPELSTELARITKSLHEATGSLASYDQRQCEQTLRDLEANLEALRLRTKPKSKFAFKRAVPSNTPTQTPQPVLHTAPAQEEHTVSSHLKLAAQKYVYLDWSALHPFSAEQSADLSLSDLEGCIVNLISNSALSLSAVHIRNVRDTVLLLPCITGSALIHATERCVIVLGCHQLRMHDSRWVDVYLNISSTPVIEHTSDVQFTTYPIAFSEQPSPPFTVQDFSHIRATPSPNWKMMNAEDSHSKWPMDRVEGSELSEALLQILPRISS